MINWDLQPTYRQIRNILQPAVDFTTDSDDFLKHAALFNQKGHLIHVAGPVPLHYFGFSQSIQNILKYFKLAQDEVIITNDPSFGSPRLCDLNFITAIYSENEIRGYAVYQLTHHGLLNNEKLMNAKSIDDEGFKIPPTPLDRKGELKNALLNYLGGSKLSTENLNLAFNQAQAALDKISDNYLVLEKKWGKQYLADKLASLESYTEEIFQKTLHRFPDGEISALTKIKNDVISTKIRVREKSFIIDFTGTSKQSATSEQCHYSVTLSACFWFFLSLLEEEVPINEGCLRALSVEAPIGSLVNPTGNVPALTGYYEISNLICQNLFKITQKALPRDGDTLQMKETFNLLIQTPKGVILGSLGSGQNATPFRSGANAVKTDWSNLQSGSMEKIETRFPYFADSYFLNLRPEKTFQKRGGLGVSFTFTLKEPSKIKVLSGPGSFLEMNVIHQGKKQPVTSGRSTDILAGDSVSVTTANGLDWGPKDQDD